MTSTIDPGEIEEWCRIPIRDLENHPQARIKLRILDTPDEVHRWLARDMADAVKEKGTAGLPTKWILPCGPTAQYPYFAKIVNDEQISLEQVHVFHMDDYLDWEGRPLPLNHPFSMEGWMRRHFYASVDKTLQIPEENRHFPRIGDLDGIADSILAFGGIDTTYGGVGYRGHIAYNEPPRSPWYTVTMEQFKHSKTRVLHLNEDTLIAVSQRRAGGCSHVVPPMAITLGMAELLSARRIRLAIDTGAWKQTVLRVLLFSQPTLEYPVTLVQGHPDVMVVVDRLTAESPLED
jgi:glucosamine-6-phosphate deaminase